MPRWILPFVGLTAALATPHAHASALEESGQPPAAASPDSDTAPPQEKQDKGESTLPDAVRRMIMAALESGNSGEIATVTKYAVNAAPEAAAEIQKIVEDHRGRAEAERRQTIRQAGLFDLWDGKIELGGFRSTGSSSEFGINTAIAITRKGLSWKHDFVANADYREANGERSQERLLASYSPTYNFDSRNFAYGLAQVERDPVVGYDYRFTGSLGIGYTFIATDTVNLSATLGPSLRETRYTEDGTETKFGGRSSLNFKWKFNPTIALQQTASAYAESDTASLVSLTALDARIITKLSARLSYNMRYESGSKLTDRAFDTTSRVTLIYDF